MMHSEDTNIHEGAQHLYRWMFPLTTPAHVHQGWEQKRSSR